MGIYNILPNKHNILPTKRKLYNDDNKPNTIHNKHTSAQKPYKIRGGKKKMGKYCTECGKQNEYPEYELCKECYRDKQQGVYRRENGKEDGWNKIVPIPIWVLALILIIGVFIGATLW